jgi:hypothetical protein
MLISRRAFSGPRAASQLPRDTRVRVGGLAQILGYSEVGAFTRFFTSMAGQSPSQRKQQEFVGTNGLVSVTPHASSPRVGTADQAEAEPAGAPDQNCEAKRRQLREGRTFERLSRAVDLIVVWESGEFCSDMATDLAIALYPVFRE